MNRRITLSLLLAALVAVAVLVPAPLSAQTANAVKNWLSQTDPNPISELPDALRRAELEPSVETALVALGIALDDADAGGPRRLSKRLQTDPARSAFQSVLAQLGSARLLRLLDWLSEPGKSSRHSLLTALFTPGADRKSVV